LHPLFLKTLGIHQMPKQITRFHDRPKSQTAEQWAVEVEATIDSYAMMFADGDQVACDERERIRNRVEILRRQESECWDRIERTAKQIQCIREEGYALLQNALDLNQKRNG
jgi:hypothetical protein